MLLWFPSSTLFVSFVTVAASQMLPCAVSPRLPPIIPSMFSHVKTTVAMCSFLDMFSILLIFISDLYFLYVQLADSISQLYWRFLYFEYSLDVFAR